MKGTLNVNRIIKVIIVLILFTLFFIDKLGDEKSLTSGFAHEPSYLVGENIKFSMIGESKKTTSIAITSLTNESYFEVDINPFKTSLNGEVLLEGVKDFTTNEIKNKKLKSGIYLINDTIPFVVKNPSKKADIVVVYPYVNNLISTKFDNKSVGTEKNTYTSINRSNYVDEISLSMKGFFRSISEKYSVKFISDIDLEDSTNISGAKLLIFYNDLLYATTNMKNNTLNYLKSGGNILLASTYFFNNVIWMNKLEPHSIILNKKAKSKGVSSQERFGVSLWEVEKKYIDEYIGFSYAYGGIGVENKGYEIILKDSPLFKHLTFSRIPVLGKKYIGLLGEAGKTGFIFNLDGMVSVKTHAFLATSYRDKKGASGIIELKLSQNSGTILSFGTDEWFSEWNYGKSEDIRKISIDAIAYLLAD